MATCLALGSSEARAQTAVVYPDPLAPNLTDPRRQQRFQNSLPPLAQAGQPTTTFAPFTAPPPASGAGNTGFDSTNARKKTPPKPKTNATSDNAVQPQAAAPPPSSYQTPPPGQEPAQTDEGNAALAAVPPGTPAIQPIEEIRLAKKKKTHEPNDPFAPLGIRAGAFDLFPAFELSGGYSANPGATPQPKGAWLYSVAPELKVQSAWLRHELKADIHGNYTGFSPDQTPTLSRPFLDGKVEGRVDVTHDTRIDLDGKVLVSTDAPNSPNLQAGLAKLPVFVTYGGGAGLGQRFSRFDVSLKGNVERTVYQDSHLTDGTTASNEDRNYNQYGGKLRGGYEIFPGVTPFVEVEADTRKHDLNTDFFGFQRDSTGVTGKAGSTFEITRVFAGEVALGYTKREYQDPRLSDVAGLIGNASLIWTATALTSLKLMGSSTIGEVDIPGVSGALYRDVALQVDHAFRRWLIGSVKVGFGLDDYVGLDRIDHRYSVAAGLTYKLDRSWQVKGEVRQDWLRSNNSGNNYNNTTFLLGLRWQK